MAKRGRAGPLRIPCAGSLELFEVSNVPLSVSRQMPLGWGGAPVSASVLADCQRPKLYAFPSQPRKQPSRGFCPCIIQEAPALETANTDFLSPGGSLSPATIVQDCSVACMERHGSDPLFRRHLSGLPHGGACEGTHSRRPERLWCVSKVPDLFFFVLSKNTEARSKQQPALLESAAWHHRRLQGHLVAWRSRCRCPETLKQPA